MFNLFLFIILQFVNVILGTLRSLCTIKANLHVGMMMNVISYTFYTAVIKLLTEQSLVIVIIVTAATNCIGFYIAQAMFNRLQKDKLWRITAAVSYEKGKAIDLALSDYNIPFSVRTTENNKTSIFDIFSKTRGESILIKEVLTKNSAKYYVIEIEKSL